jgi:hypothetical protein
MFYRLGVMAERGIHFGLSFDSTDGILTVPEDCYINHVDITSRPGGYRRTKLKMDNKDKYENLYLN